MFGERTQNFKYSYIYHVPICWYSMVLFFPQTVYCWGSQCCLKCVRLGWGAVSASLGLSPACLPSGLGCCVRLAGLVFLLSSVLSPSLSPIWSGMLCPPRWSCLPLVYGLVSPSLSPIWSGMLCPPRWSCLSLVFGLVSHLVWVAGRVFLLSPVLCPSLSSSWSGMRCLCSGVVHKKSCAIGETVWGLRWCNSSIKQLVYDERDWFGPLDLEFGRYLVPSGLFIAVQSCATWENGIGPQLVAKPGPFELRMPNVSIWKRTDKFSKAKSLIFCQGEIMESSLYVMDPSLYTIVDKWNPFQSWVWPPPS